MSQKSHISEICISNSKTKFQGKKKISLSGSVDVYSPAKFVSQAKGVSCFQTSSTNKVVFN